MLCAQQWASQTLAPQTSMETRASEATASEGKLKFLLEGEVPLGKGQECGHSGGTSSPSLGRSASAGALVGIQAWSGFQSY